MSSIDYRIIKYPRTPHIEGSRLQPGDEDLSQVPFRAIAGKHLVVEEKIDGANSAISFDPQGNLLLQSRGHYLTGGYRERHYNLFKQWANIHYDMLWKLLGCRYVMYGEWMYAKHSIYYDALPHYFMEFDILDRETDRFLDTKTRHEMTDGLPICHVPVLGEGEYTKREDLMRHLGNSRFITDAHLDNLRIAAQRADVDPDRACRETDPSLLMEGLYIKIEENGEVTGRVKFVRHGFSQVVSESNSHWIDRPIILNGLSLPFEELLIPVYDKE